MIRCALLAIASGTLLLGCSAVSDNPIEPEVNPLFTTAASGGDDFEVKGITVGPDHEIVRVSEESELCGVEIVTFGDKETKIERHCTTSILNEPTSTTYNGGHIDVYGSVDGETKSLGVVPGDLSERIEVFTLPAGGAAIFFANALCDFLHYEVTNDAGETWNVYSHELTYTGGDLKRVLGWYQCNE